MSWSGGTVTGNTFKLSYKTWSAPEDGAVEHLEVGSLAEVRASWSYRYVGFMQKHAVAIIAAVLLARFEHDVPAFTLPCFHRISNLK